MLCYNQHNARGNIKVICFGFKNNSRIWGFNSIGKQFLFTCNIFCACNHISLSVSNSYSPAACSKGVQHCALST